MSARDTRKTVTVDRVGWANEVLLLESHAMDALNHARRAEREAREAREAAERLVAMVHEAKVRLVEACRVADAEVSS